jgi:predicted aspartyl protease
VKVAQVPLEPVGRLFSVPVTLNSHPISMLLDTGAERSLLAEATVLRLNVERNGQTVTAVAGLAGGTMRADASIGSMSIGGVPIAVDRMAVGSLGGNQTVDGTLGLDILRDFDLDIDAPHRALTLYRVRRCERADPPWQETAIPIAGVSTMSRWLEAPVEIDGVSATAVLDTGASYSSITPRLARQLGLTDQILADDRTLNLHVISGPDTQARIHRFKSIRIGPVTMHDRYALVLAKNPAALGGGRRFPEALIGQDFLSHWQVWFSLRTDRLYISGQRSDAEGGGQATTGH